MAGAGTLDVAAVKELLAGLVDAADSRFVRIDEAVRRGESSR